MQYVWYIPFYISSETWCVSTHVYWNIAWDLRYRVIWSTVHMTQSSCNTHINMHVFIVFYLGGDILSILWLMQQISPYSAVMHFMRGRWCNPAGYVDGLVQDCNNPGALAMELLQSNSKPSRYKSIKPPSAYFRCSILTRWDRVTYICVYNPTSIDSDNGFSPGRHQAIMWTNAWKLLIQN